MQRQKAFCSQVETLGVAQMRRRKAFCSQVETLGRAQMRRRKAFCSQLETLGRAQMRRHKAFCSQMEPPGCTLIRLRAACLGVQRLERCESSHVNDAARSDRWGEDMRGPGNAEHDGSDMQRIRHRLDGSECDVC